MGQCLGKPKNVKTYDSYKLESKNTNSTQKPEESIEEKRRKAAEAAEKRMEKQSTKGVIENGGKLSKKLYKQKSIGPGRSGESYVENKALDPAQWN
jgi:hypothetical protein